MKITRPARVSILPPSLPALLNRQAAVFHSEGPPKISRSRISSELNSRLASRSIEQSSHRDSRHRVIERSTRRVVECSRDAAFRSCSARERSEFASLRSCGLRTFASETRNSQPSSQFPLAPPASRLSRNLHDLSRCLLEPAARVATLIPERVSQHASTPPRSPPPAPPPREKAERSAFSGRGAFSKKWPRVCARARARARNGSARGFAEEGRERRID